MTQRNLSENQVGANKDKRLVQTTTTTQSRNKTKSVWSYRRVVVLFFFYALQGITTKLLLRPFITDGADTLSSRPKLPEL